MSSDPARLLKVAGRRFQSSGRACLRGLSQVAPVLVGVPLGLAALIALGNLFFEKAATSPAIQIIVALLGTFLVVQVLIAQWDSLPETRKHHLSYRWGRRIESFFLARALGLWPVGLALLTSLLGMSDWITPGSPDRSILLASVTLLALYGYGRTQAEKKRDLLAFANEAAKQIHLERNREIEARETEVEKAKQDALIDRINRSR